MEAVRRDDRVAVAVFKNLAIPNEAKSAKEGRPMFDDMEVVEIRFPGSRDVRVFPANVISHVDQDPFSGAQIRVTYAERFRKQYEQFKTHAQQTMSGTPLSMVTFLTEARRAELRALNIYTVEALAHIDGNELKNLGYAGRDLKNSAEKFIEDAKARAPDSTMRKEIEAMTARMQALEDDNTRLREKSARLAVDEATFDEMTTDQLRDYVTQHAGRPPQGGLSRNTLLRMAKDYGPKSTVAQGQAPVMEPA